MYLLNSNILTEHVYLRNYSNNLLPFAHYFYPVFYYIFLFFPHFFSCNTSAPTFHRTPRHSWERARVHIRENPARSTAFWLVFCSSLMRQCTSELLLCWPFTPVVVVSSSASLGRSTSRLWADVNTRELAAGKGKGSSGVNSKHFLRSTFLFIKLLILKKKILFIIIISIFYFKCIVLVPLPNVMFYAIRILFI